MSIGKCLYTFFLMPLQILFEAVYTIALKFIGHPGLAIILLSLTINLLVLPLYMRADAIQEEERKTEEKLKRGIAHIKKTFRGDERTMMLQTYYRQNHYSPLHTLRSALSLLLEIPFFIAAYRFLSTLSLLSGASLGPISDLSMPDHLIHVWGISLNLLPILMTVLNLISAWIYTKKAPLKTKIQLYAMATFFLFFLYDSPSGLVFYWTLNNLFSLIKTIFYQLKHPKRVLFYLIQLTGISFFAIGVYFLIKEGFGHRVLFLFVFSLFAILLLFYRVFRSKLPKLSLPSKVPDPKLFFLCSATLALLIGALIPSAVIRTSPQEFVILGHFVHPVWYVLSAVLLASGTFVFWCGVFYKLASSKGKTIFEYIMYCLIPIALSNYLFFGKNFGILNPDLKYKNISALEYSTAQIVLNLAVLIGISLFVILLFKKWHKNLHYVPIVALLTICIMSGLNVSSILRSVSQINSEQYGNEQSPHITLSRDGKNVVVIMLDRAMGEYVPYIFAEKPELSDAFSGFTYYGNTISFGLSTNFGTPALYGGYEYTPLEMNSRTDMTLGEKHDEALKVMPVLFLENGYNVTVCDPTYAGYGWIPDLSIYDEYPDINTYITSGYFSGVESGEHQIQNRFRNFFCYSLMKVSPVMFQRDLYNNGVYNEPRHVSMIQTVTDLYHAEGISSDFLDPFNVLQNLSFMTNVVSGSADTFFMMSNDTTHEPCLLQLPDYSPNMTVNNEEYPYINGEHFYTYNGRKLKLETTEQVIHYQANMATMLQLASWFDYLRSEGVYDNTRIILVADHGNGLHQIEDLYVGDGFGEMKDKEWLFPLLMVKDFDCTGFVYSDDFMTNADVPALAVKNLIEDPSNPFTGKPIDNTEKTAHDQYILYSYEWNTLTNNGTAFLPGTWYSVHDSIWDESNWTLIAEDEVLVK